MPIHCLSGGLGWGELLNDVSVVLCGVRPALPAKCNPSEGQAELGLKLGTRKVALHANTLGAIVIQEQNSGCPDDVETVKPRRMLFNVHVQGDELLINKRRDLGIGVRLGLQPSACASSRGGAEV